MVRPQPSMQNCAPSSRPPSPPSRQLVSYTWLSNETTGRYGAFYVFQSKPAFDAFVASELYDMLREHRTVDDLTASDFSIEPVPTALTRGPAAPPHEPSVR